MPTKTLTMKEALQISARAYPGQIGRRMLVSSLENLDDSDLLYISRLPFMTQITELMKTNPLLFRVFGKMKAGGFDHNIMTLTRTLCWIRHEVLFIS